MREGERSGIAVTEPALTHRRPELLLATDRVLPASAGIGEYVEPGVKVRCSDVQHAVDRLRRFPSFVEPDYAQLLSSKLIFETGQASDDQKRPIETKRISLIYAHWV